MATFDNVFPLMIKNVVKILKEKDDDFLLMIVGSTGTGKSNLMLHAYTEFARLTNSTLTIKQVGLNRQDFATAINNLSVKKEKFCGYDEANINKREWASQWNKDVMDLYFSIRGLNVFHVWCNPSIEWIDKPFIEERIKGLIFIYTKGKQARRYWYFTKAGLLRMLEKEGDLKHRTIRKHGMKYMFYEGHFTKYDGELLAEYLAKKDDRMKEKVESFFEKYGRGELFNAKQAAQKLNMSEDTAQKGLAYALKAGYIPPESKNAAGRWCLTEKDIENLYFVVQNGLHNGDGSVLPAKTAHYSYTRDPNKNTKEALMMQALKEAKE